MTSKIKWIENLSQNEEDAKIQKGESQNTEQCPSARARCCNKIKCAEVPKDQCCSSGKSMSQYNLILQFNWNPIPNQQRHLQRRKNILSDIELWETISTSIQEKQQLWSERFADSESSKGILTVNIKKKNVQRVSLLVQKPWLMNIRLKR